MPGYCPGYLVINTLSSKEPSITKSQICRVAQTLSIKLAYVTPTLEEAGDDSTETSILPGSRMDFPGIPSGIYAIGALMSSSYRSLRPHHLLCCHHLSLHQVSVTTEDTSRNTPPQSSAAHQSSIAGGSHHVANTAQSAVLLIRLPTLRVTRRKAAT